MTPRETCDICGARYVMTTNPGVHGMGSTSYECPNRPHWLARLRRWLA